ncbi:hypothetical protein [Bradyrhizobium japonicum]|uniref:hypothetical protein n=1 Tax=Bradyrhizobium japonicum TaxID=375 RepID=UPI001269D09D|nr:hypothetical protein [Bradyrhizobium japonicum]
MHNFSFSTVAFQLTGLAMPNGVEDLQILRLIKAFRKIADPDARRMVVLFAEEQLQKQEAKVERASRS